MGNNTIYDRIYIGCYSIYFYTLSFNSAHSNNRRNMGGIWR